MKKIKIKILKWKINLDLNKVILIIFIWFIIINFIKKQVNFNTKFFLLNFITSIFFFTFNITIKIAKNFAIFIPFITK